MYYYYILLFPYIYFIYRNFSSNYKNTVYKGLFYAFIIPVFIISSCRYYVGSDYESYSDIFYYDLPIEPLYKLIQNFSKLIINKYEFLVFIIFGLAFCLKTKCFNKLSYQKGILLTFISYFSFYYIAYDINAIRQGLALGFTMIAGYYAFEKKLQSFLIFTTIASLIHYTAICFYPLYYLLTLSYNKKHIWGIILSCIILSAINIFNQFINITESLFSGSIIAAKIYNYGTSEAFANNILFSFSTVRRLFFFIILLFTLKKIPANYKIKHFLFVTGFLSIVFYLLFSNVNFFATRISVYYRIFECIWFSYLPFIFKRKTNQLIISLLLILYFLAQVHSALQAEFNGLLPIRLFFFQ